MKYTAAEIDAAEDLIELLTPLVHHLTRAKDLAEQAEAYDVADAIPDVLNEAKRCLRKQEEIFNAAGVEQDEEIMRDYYRSV